MTEDRPPKHQDGPALACVILAHADPTQLRRLIDALEPFPVFLHIDRATSPGDFAAMTADLPRRVAVLPRLSTGWAKWENVEAELAGYRAALTDPAITHVALLTGTDYPLAPSERISEVLAEYRGQSIAAIGPLPQANWGRSGGFARLKYPHFAFRKHMIRLPVPRAYPADIVLAGGSQLKVLARHHAQAVLDATDSRPDLVRFWRRSWVPDETFIPSMLSTPHIAPDWVESRVHAELWWIGWGGGKRKSPPWLSLTDLDRIRANSQPRDGLPPKLFARKFATDVDTGVLDVIDQEFRLATV